MIFPAGLAGDRQDFTGCLGSPCPGAGMGQSRLIPREKHFAARAGFCYCSVDR